MPGKIEKYIKATEALLGDKELMTHPAEEMSAEALVAAYLVLDGLLKDKGALDERKKEIREQLLERVKKDGKVPNKEKGHQEMTVAGTRVVRERRVATMPDEQELKALVEKSKGVEMKDVVTIVKTAKIDASKITALVTLGKLDSKKVEKMKKVTWALKVVAGEVPKGMLAEAHLRPAK